MYIVATVDFKTLVRKTTQEAAKKLANETGMNVYVPYNGKCQLLYCAGDDDSQ